MIKHAVVVLIFAFILNGCGKKEEPQTQHQPQQNQQQQTQQQTQQQQTQQQQTTTTDADKKKEEEKKKKEDEEKKKKEEEAKKKKEEELKKKEETTAIDFAPIYAKKCAKCHGPNGKGKVEGTPDFTSSKIKSKTDKQLFNSISNGIKAETEDADDMPAWKGKLTDDEIHAAAKYVKSF